MLFTLVLYMVLIAPYVLITSLPLIRQQWAQYDQYLQLVARKAHKVRGNPRLLFLQP